MGLFLCLLVACEKSDSAKVDMLSLPTPVDPIKTTDKPLTGQPQSPVGSTEIKPPVINVVTSCQDSIKNDSAIEVFREVSPSEISLTINSNKIIDNDSTEKWLKDFVYDLFDRQQCPYKTIAFTTIVDEYSYLQGLITRLDFDLFKQQKISEPEWIRRFDIKKMTTTEAVRASLRKARQLGDSGTALELVEKLLLDDYASTALKIIKANILVEQKQYVEAIDIYRDVILQEPFNVNAWFNLSYCQKMAGQFAEAVENAKKLLAFITEPAKQEVYLKALGLTRDDLWLHLAECYSKNNEIILAQEALNKVVTKNNPVYGLLTANLLRLDHKAEQARTVLLSLLDTGQRQDLVFYNLVVLSLDLKDEKGAQDYYQMLRENHPNEARELAFVMNLPKHVPAETDTPLVVSTPVTEEQLAPEVNLPPAAIMPVVGDQGTKEQRTGE
ncbi:MAG: hypothetical protein ACD_62C00496G0004 [uncultured bacterium]|nr:MAG: hypothetical protein ACD_62C00496G0004 [uncultured bacterium]